MPGMSSASVDHDQESGILCMFSGGLDSLGALFQLLTLQDYAACSIHVHHMVLQNIENRANAENAACGNILHYLRHNGYRHFEYSESVHEYQFLRRFYIYDTALTGFMAAQIMREYPHIHQLATGATKDDLEPDENVYRRINMGRRIFYTSLPLDIRYQRTYLHPVQHLTHKEVYQMLPADLRDLAWSCRHPVYRGNQINECGKCQACIRMREIRLSCS